jgi:hypothetical protein
MQFISAPLDSLPLGNMYTMAKSGHDGSRFYIKRRIVVGNLSKYIPAGR